MWLTKTFDHFGRDGGLWEQRGVLFWISIQCYVCSGHRESKRESKRGRGARESEHVIFWVIACEVVVRYIFLFIYKFRDVGLCEITLNKFCSNCFTIWLTSNLISLKVRYFLFKYQK